MLGQRIVTAVVLLALLLPAMFAGSPWPFAVLTLVFIAAAGWEWSRLNGGPGVLALAAGALVAAACGAVLADGLITGQGGALWGVVALLWIAGGALALRAGPAGWPRWPQPLRWALGLVLLWAAWLAMAQARVVGVNFLLSVMCVVWVADIAAYFGGRAFGRRKLAPTISPGKSWEGVWSGLAGVMLLALSWQAADAHWALGSPSVFTLLAQRFGVVGMVAGTLALAAMSVVGDLFESLVKRAAGAKDSSALLPGHGGVLDRIDALLPVLPIAMALTRW